MVITFFKGVSIYIDADEKTSLALSEAAESLNINTVSGTVASGDQFIASKDKKTEIVAGFNAIACEMEGAAIGQVCYVNGKPFAVLRAISDSADGSAELDYPTFSRMAAENYVNVVCGYLKSL